MTKKRKMILRMTLSSIIGALYAVITIFTAPISYGALQFRAAEALNVLPLFFPESILGLTIGCLISNFFTPGNVLLDTTLGTLGTLLASVTAYLIGRFIKKEPLRVIIGILPAIIFNAILVPFTFLAVSELQEAYFIEMAWVGLGQLGVLTILGIPFYYAFKAIDKRYNFLYSSK